MLAARDLLARVPLASRHGSFMIWDADRETARDCCRAASPTRRSPASTRPRRCSTMRGCGFLGLGSSSRTSPTGRRRRATPIFANAALHFLPDHHALFPRLASMLAPRRRVCGANAVRRRGIVARAHAHGRGRRTVVVRLVPIAKTQPLIADFEDYYEWLRPVASRIDMWMTTYIHDFDGPEASPTGSPVRLCSRFWSDFR